MNFFLNWDLYQTSSHGEVKIVKDALMPLLWGEKEPIDDIMSLPEKLFFPQRLPKGP